MILSLYSRCLLLPRQLVRSLPSNKASNVWHYYRHYANLAYSPRKMIIEPVPCLSDNYAYLLIDPTTKEGIDYPIELLQCHVYSHLKYDK
jgi:hypothetical protein